MDKLIIAITALAILLLSGVGDAAIYCDNGWSYQQLINVSNTAGILTDYQVRININLTDEYDAGTLNSTCKDVRFLNTTANLSYWIETCNITGGNSTIWVKVPFMQDNTNTSIYMCYGNFGVESTTDGDATYEFFDDFEGSNLNYIKWHNQTWDHNCNMVIENSWVKLIDYVSPGSPYASKTVETCMKETTDPIVQFVAGKTENAVVFDGENDFLDCHDNIDFNYDTNESLSIALFVKTTAEQDLYDGLFTHGAWIPQLRYVIESDASEHAVFGVRTDAGAVRLASTSSFNDGDWHSIVGTWNGTLMKIYFDGVEENSVAQTGTIQYDRVMKTAIGYFFDCCGQGNQYYFNGTLDEIALWDRAITLAEVDHFNDTGGGILSDVGLISNWHLNHTLKGYYLEDSVSGYNCDPVGFPQTVHGYNRSLRMRINTIASNSGNSGWFHIDDDVSIAADDMVVGQAENDRYIIRIDYGDQDVQAKSFPTGIHIYDFIRKSDDNILIYEDAGLEWDYSGANIPDQDMSVHLENYANDVWYDFVMVRKYAFPEPTITFEVALTCTCVNCTDCEAKLNDVSCAVVYLKADITGKSGTCITAPANFENKTFDCQGHTIDGDDSGTDKGVYLSGRDNNTIKNCVVTDFYIGIQFVESANNTLFNCTANSNLHSGILLDGSSDNNLTNCTANSNGVYGFYIGLYSLNNRLVNNTITLNQDHGVYIDDYSTGNVLNSNRVCDNNQSGGGYEDLADYDANTGDNNTCDTAYNWNDTGDIGCHFACSGVYCGQVLTANTTLTANIACSGDAFYWGGVGIYLDCNGFNITGDGTGTGLTINDSDDSGILRCYMPTSFATSINISNSNNTLLNFSETSQCEQVNYSYINMDDHYIQAILNDSYQGIIYDLTKCNFKNIKTISINETAFSYIMQAWDDKERLVETEWVPWGNPGWFITYGAGGAVFIYLMVFIYRRLRRLRR